MRLSQSFLGITVMLAGGWLPAQTLAEHSSAAAGGSAAGVAGKTVSDSINRVMGGGVARPMEKASHTGATTVARPVTKAETKEIEKSRAGNAASAVPAAPFDGGAAASKRVRHPRVIPASEIRPSVRHKAAEVSERAPLMSVMKSAPPPAIPTVAGLKSIKPGVSRKEVVARLGQPADRIQMADESGHLAELMHYVTPASDLGTVRMSDGVVTEVTVAN